MQSAEFNQFLPLFQLIHLSCFKDIQMETVTQIIVKEKNKSSFASFSPVFLTTMRISFIMVSNLVELNISIKLLLSLFNPRAQVMCLLRKRRPSQCPALHTTSNYAHAIQTQVCKKGENCSSALQNLVDRIDLEKY